jgi:hypothetical protein
MPLFVFKHPSTGKVIEVVQKMTEPHYFTDEEGVTWTRIFTIPRASVDTKIDPNSAKEFVAKTAKNGMTLGEMQDLSAELSEKRGGTTGQDEVRQKAEDSYTRATKKPHPHSKKKQETIYI